MAAATPRSTHAIDAATTRTTIDDHDLLRTIPFPAWAAYDMRDPWPTLPGYASTMTRDAGLPERMRPQARSGFDPELRFAPAALSTFCPSVLRPWLTVAEWRAVEVLVSVEAFRERVLRPDADAIAATMPPPRVSALAPELEQDLIDKQYLRRRGADAGRALRACLVFAIVKSCLTALRMIWDGREFNALCHPPPKFSITRLDVMRAKLLDRRVKAYVVYDFQTWFLQFILHPEVRAFFTTTLKSGEVAELEGAPMGWSWACTLAQAMTVAFARAVLQDLRASPDELIAEFCIDNTIIATTTDTITTEAILASVRKVAERTGIRVKPSSVDSGTTVEWLMYQLDCTTRTATFKEAYRQRLLSAAAKIRNGFRRRDPTLLEAWSVSGLLIFTIYAAGQSLRPVRPLLEWLAAHAPPTQDRSAWLNRAPLPYPRMQRELILHLAQATAQPPLLPGGAPSAWCVTDAAGDGDRQSQQGLNAVVISTPSALRLEVYRCSSPDIASRELCAQLRAFRSILEMLPDDPEAREAPRPPCILSFVDNEVARAALRRGFSMSSPDGLAASMHDTLSDVRQTGHHPNVLRVDTHHCLADPWTRTLLRGDPVPEGVTVWERTCGHPWVPTVLCPCEVDHLRDTGADMTKVRRWLDEPPCWRSSTDPYTTWHDQGVIAPAGQ